jgi:uncharacterized protein (TIGR02145 family)
MILKNRIWFFSLTTSFFLFFSCEKQKDIVYLNLNPWIEYGSMTDRDGNSYKTIHIGNQTWMVKNLSTTMFNDGTAIPIVNDASLWGNLLTPACCWQNNDPIRKVTYGVMYNWYAVNTGKLCPTGWHVSSDEEWTELTDYLGSEKVAGGKLKESGFSHWKSPNAGATDEATLKLSPEVLVLMAPMQYSATLEKQVAGGPLHTLKTLV